MMTTERWRSLSSQPFYATILIISTIAAFSIVSARFRPEHDGLGLVARSADADDDCGLVHDAEDQCAFVRAHCDDEDAGLLPYLELYYCGLGHAKPVAFVILLLWLATLFTTIGIAASDFFSVNLSTIATILGLSESLAGVTFLAFGNGSPDLFSTFAAMGSNSASMAVGELIGAAGFITAVVAGSMALVREFKVDRKTFIRDLLFFIVAVSFTVGFLADGHLHFVECIVMISYYIIYVLTVVGWHWISTRRERRKAQQEAARSSGDGTGAHLEPYRDDPNAEPDHRPHSRVGTNLTEISALELGPRIEIEGQRPPDDDLDGESQRRGAAEVANSMRVLRPRVLGRRRRSTLTPIRPSLVGALEFRSALGPGPREGKAPSRSQSETQLDDGSSRAQGEGGEGSPHTLGGLGARSRAVSLGQSEGTSVLPPPAIVDESRARADSSLSVQSSTVGRRSPSPSNASFTVGGSLAPPPRDGFAPRQDIVESQPLQPLRPLSPRLEQLKIPSRQDSLPTLSPPGSPFPRYTDSPMVMTPNPQTEPSDYLGAAMPRRDSAAFPQRREEDGEDSGIEPVQLPAWEVLLRTLFPTLQEWRGKTIWDKLFSTLCVPSVLLLIVTLPVVDSEKEGDSGDGEGSNAAEGGIGEGLAEVVVQRRIRAESGSGSDVETEWQRYRRNTRAAPGSPALIPLHSPIRGRSASTALPNQDNQQGQGSSDGQNQSSNKQPVTGGDPQSLKDDPSEWNRWLVALQMFMGPQFAVFVLWANMKDDLDEPGKAYVRMFIWTLLGSLVLLGVLITTTKVARKPRYHYLLCFLGFIISIAWISTIAGEVVGVLKTFGVILNASEAILGLTIFAAGNSVGDLVADITVARLGYPVMALSACFGGPMLNILLGIGIGGLWMMIKSANHKHAKHPHRKPKWKPFRIGISGTLMISAISLFITLVALLVLVPMSGWMLTRKIGYGLIALWAISTIVNVVVELTGAWAEVA